MAYLSKRLRKAREGREERPLPLGEALNHVVARANARFDETVEIALALGIEARQSDQIVRGVASLPHGTGKAVRVLVFARGEKADQARAAGADRVGAEDLKEDLMTSKIDFDRVIATPDTMALVGQMGKILGPRGLMPNPKLGTVTPNVAEAVKKVKAGDVPFRSEQGGLVHAGVER